MPPRPCLLAVFLFLSSSFIVTGHAASIINLENVVQNGSFEAITNPVGVGCSRSGSTYLNCPASAMSANRPWISSQEFDVMAPPDVNCSDGARCIDLNVGTTVATIRTPLTVTPNLPYRLTLDFGTRQCNCPTGNNPPARGAQIAVIDSASATLLNETQLYSSDHCEFFTYSFGFTSKVSSVTLYLTSSVRTTCGTIVDNVRLTWEGCYGNVPVSLSDSSIDFTATCTDHWSVAFPSVPVPLTLTAPIIIEGSLEVSELAIVINDPAAVPLTVTDTITVGGNLALDFSNVTVESDTEFVLVNASQVQGDFKKVDITFAKTGTCRTSQVEKSAMALTAIIRISECDKGGLAKWKIAVIVVCVILGVGIAIAAVVLLTHHVRNTRRLSRGQSTRRIFAGRA